MLRSFRSHQVGQRGNGLRRQGGFTLIELLVVIIILGILAAVVVFAVGGVGDKGEDAAAAEDRRTLVTAEEAFFAQNGRYATQAELVSGGLMSEESTLHDVIVSDGPCFGRPAAPDSCFDVIRATAPDTLTIAYNFDSTIWPNNFRSGVNVCEPLMKTTLSYQREFQLATGVTYLGPAPAPAPATGTGDRFRFTLRPGVKFHDGTDFDAADVMHSLQTMVTKGNYNAARLNANSVVVIDPLTVDITTTVPNGQLPSQLAHPASSMIPTGTTYSNSPVVLPVCTGPYQWVSYAPNDSLVVERFDDYWGPVAKVRQLTFLENNDSNARLLALRSGQADLAREIPRDQSVQTGLGPGLKVLTAPQGATLMLEVNAVDDNSPGPAGTDNVRSLPVPTASPILSDVSVRKALAQAINRPALISNGIAGQGLAQATLSPPSLLGESASLVNGFEHDPASAASLLDAAGWNAFDVDGVRLKGTQRLELAYHYQTVTVGNALPTLLAEQALAVGIKINLIATTSADINTRRRTGDYDLIMTSTNQGDSSPSALATAWSYKPVFVPAGDPSAGGGSTSGLGRWGVSTSTYDVVGDPDFGKDYDTLVTEGQASSDPVVTALKVAKAQHILLDTDAAMIILAGQFRVWGAEKDLFYQPHPNNLHQHWHDVT
ncbi:MAG: ABC transporter substrate-binding protein [Acidimicrobiales bacterium]